MDQKPKIFIADTDTQRLKQLIPALQQAGYTYEIAPHADEQTGEWLERWGDVLDHPKDWALITASSPFYPGKEYGDLLLQAAKSAGLPAVMCTQETGYGGTAERAKDANPNASFYSYPSLSKFEGAKLVQELEAAIARTHTPAAIVPHTKEITDGGPSTERVQA